MDVRHLIGGPSDDETTDGNNEGRGQQKLVHVSLMRAFTSGNEVERSSVEPPWQVENTSTNLIGEMLEIATDRINSASIPYNNAGAVVCSTFLQRGLRYITDLCE